MMKQAGLISHLTLLIVMAIADASESPPTTEQLRFALTQAQTELEAEWSQESAFAEADRQASEPGSTTVQHDRVTFSSLESIEKGNKHRIYVLQAKQLLKMANASSPTAILPMMRSSVAPAFQCQPSPTCDPSAQYRAADGSCNNLAHSRWGMASIPMRRWLTPAYDDGISSPRERASNFSSKLPSARLVSTIVHTPSTNDDLHAKFTHMLMQWGQFLDHDFTSTPIQQAGNCSNSSVGCCGPARRGKRRASVNPLSSPSNRPQCFPIAIPDRDRRFTSTCMNFVRSVQVANAECEPVPVDQLNQITACIDASNVYGSSQAEQNELRTFVNGELKMRRYFLPKDSQPSCATPDKPSFCFLAGDHRVNEIPTLQSMHTIFVREHNRIAKQLQELNCDWSDEKTFQETRKIVGAIMQKITYDEYLPIILGPQAMKKYRLRIGSGTAYTNVYSTTTDPSIRNAFATAAFRMGHSMIHALFSSFSSSHNFLGQDRLSEIFGDTNLILNVMNRTVGHYCRGLVKDSAQTVDHKLAEAVTDFLFPDSRGDSMDLAALNIQRGRDHGLPSYTKWRKFCNIPKAESFSDLASTTHTTDATNRLDEAYDDVHDIDLFPGALSETPVPGGLLGPTFTCLLGKQFQALKEGDRFWFEENNAYVKFTRKQLREIRKASLSRVVCDNTDTYQIQRNAFIKGSPVSCDSLREINLNKWKTECSWGIWTAWGKCIDGIQRRSRSGKNCDCTRRLRCSSESDESEENESKERDSKESGSRERGSKESGSRERGSKESGSRERGSKESGSRERGSKESGSRERGSKESGSRERNSKESGSKDRGSQESGSKDRGSKESGSRERDSKESGSKDRSSQESGSKDRGSKESGSRERDSKESGSKDRSSQESGSKDRGSQESWSKDRGSKESGSRERGSQESGSRESKLKNCKPKGSGSQGSGSEENGSKESRSKESEWRKCKSKGNDSKESGPKESGSQQRESEERSDNWKFGK
ncbi:myeloperoxidase-like [Haliotis asinina]|uniref:myeloperoxidase-like n=1 Tax=Haliotis asinina TaxID=109174 RepID=UPI0035327D40